MFSDSPASNSCQVSVSAPFSGDGSSSARSSGAASDSSSSYAVIPNSFATAGLQIHIRCPVLVLTDV